MKKIAICWLRRDLRLDDHVALYMALNSGLPVVPLFIFDSNILEELPKDDRRVIFIHQTLSKLNEELQSVGSGLHVKVGDPIESWKQLLHEYEIEKVFYNHDYEPYAQVRDQQVADLLRAHNVSFQSFKDQVIFEKSEVVKDDGTPYTVFTPYSKKWKVHFASQAVRLYDSENLMTWFYKFPKTPHFPSLTQIGFDENASADAPTKSIQIETIRNYHLNRDIPSIQGTSQLSVHLRFGTISIRKLVATATKTNEKFLNELIWREFYQSILWHFPHVVTRSFKPAYDAIKWINDEGHFNAWCQGMTGYPIVDAGMRQLNQTGWMHNRVRMIVASFLTKHLMIDWRWGEAYFAKKLIDFELASNNGGWQWAAGSGVDAAPYFRIFNPYIQTKKFDAALHYINHWVPELNSLAYPKPIIEHEIARERCLKIYKEALNNK